jgi:hypothetical protein
MQNTLANNYINHIGLVIDASISMRNHSDAVIKVTDNQVKYLAKRSQELDQETRATSYMFNDTVKCVHYDKDVLRLPSMSQLYRVSGNTALIDATLQCIEDLEKTPELYGDHAFLIYVITDGEENVSRRRSYELTQKLKTLPDNWTVAVLVPNATGVFSAKAIGFPAQNISVWDTTSSRGFEEAGARIREATDAWMTNRQQGVRSSKNLFKMDLDVTNLNSSTVNNTLKRLGHNDYHLMSVHNDSVIRPFIERSVGVYNAGKAYYQITKAETIQSTKKICVLDTSNGSVFTGPEARNLLGLPNQDARVKPADHRRYEIFVQSTSHNRKLIGGTKVLVLK